jgi:uncharacterized protein YdcH (DUF465 family)
MTLIFSVAAMGPSTRATEGRISKRRQSSAPQYNDRDGAKTPHDELTRLERKMSHVAHELHEEFPEHAEAIHSLKASNAHFARIAEEYHTLNRTIHRMETNVEPADDATIEALKKKRLALKDEIAGFLATV